MSKVRERKSRRRYQKKLRTLSAHQQTNPAQLEKQLDSGIEHQQSGRLAEAEACYQQVLQWQPNHADAWHLLGLIAYQQEDYATAIERINRALQLNAKAANFHNSLGSVYQKLYNLDQALECYQKAIQLQPDSFQTHNNIGLVYQEQGQLEQAIEYYQRAIKLHPSYAEAYLNSSIAYEKQTQLGKANTFCHKAIQLQPAYADAHCQLGRLLSKKAKSKEATESYRRALEVNPNHAVAQHDLMINLLYYSGDYEPSMIAAEHRLYAERHAKPLAAAIQPHRNDRNSERRLRIGYVSGDFKAHSVAYFLEPLLAAHNSNDCEVICYANNKINDATTERLKQLADGWREIHALNDEQVAERVRQDGIDILVDLSGHTRGARLMVFARKPAPVQVSYLGYPSTTGLETIDYRLTDGWADPEGQTEHLHTEQLIRLPHGFLCYQPSADCPDVSPPPVLQAKHVTFGSFNNLAKVNPELIGRWVEILKAVPDSRLIIKAKPLVDPDTRASIQGLFQQHEIGPERLELLGWLDDKIQHLASYAQVDIALDTFPYHGTTTTCEAMWMGVPVITRAGQAHVSRVGVSLLSSVGLEELIAESAEDYIQKAIDLANNLERLQALRANLRSRMQTAPLTNAKLITQSLEDAYRTMWQRWCSQEEVPSCSIDKRASEVENPQKIETEQINKQFELGVKHYQSGKLSEAESCFQKVVQWQPSNPDAWHLLGVISAQQQQYETAIEQIVSAIKLKPTEATFHSNLGNVYLKQKQIQIACECCQKALKLKPDYPEAHYNLGIALKEQGKLEKAIESYQRTLQLKPDYPVAHYNLGVALKEQGKLEKAIESYQRALQLKPDYSEAHHNLGIAYKEQGKLEAAIESYQSSIQVKPDYYSAHNNLGCALKEQGKLEEAIESYQSVIQLKPDYPEAYYNLGCALQEQGRLAEAIESFERALQLKPDYPEAYSNLLFSLHYSSDYGPSAIYAKYQQWAERIAAPLVEAIQPHPNKPDPERRLRIGYVSGDFKTHSVAYFFEPILEAHNHSDFEIICYANNKKVDTTTERLRQFADDWHFIHALNDEQVAQLVRQDCIDILVDLSGHTRDNRLLVFAQKPAPVQVSYLGYPSTTGLDTIDYRFTDAWADPEKQTEHLNGEELVRLPHGFLCYQPPIDCPEVSPAPVLKSNQITVASFNNLAKVSPQLVSYWSDILKAVPDSRMIVKSKPLVDPSTCDYLEGLFQQHGIEPDRLELIGWTASPIEHLALYSKVDIALDTFPYNGTTTTCEALWMGVPVITLAGQTHVSRVGVSLLSSIGLEELIAESAEDYIQKAIDMANNLERLQALRATLRARMAAAPLTNASLIARSLEDAYQTMWQSFCAESQSKTGMGNVSLQVNSTQIQEQLNLAIEHHQAERFAEAEACYQQILQWQPDHADVWHLLGVIAAQQKQYPTAIARIKQAIEQRAIEHKPESAILYCNLGNAYQESGQLDQAIECYQKVIQLQPDHVEAYKSMGIALKEQGHLEAAVQAYQKVVQLKPDYADAHHKLGHALQLQRRIKEAFQCYQQALEIQPDNHQTYNNLAMLLQSQGQTKKAILLYQKALELESDYAIAHSNLLFSLHFSDDEPEAIYVEHVKWAERHAKPLTAAIQPSDRDRDPARPLRIGYVSGDFYTHSVAYFLEPLLANRNQNAFEVICYVNNKKVDATTERLRKLSDGWREIYDLEDEQVAELVHQDRIDILVDLSGHTKGSRMLVFARKPAPVQVTYIGYPNTTGLDTIDYRLTDAWADPEGETEHLHTEQLVRLPHGFLCYQPPVDCPEVSPPPVLQTGQITFGSFNNLAKVNPKLISNWAEILKTLPNSRLIVKSKALVDADTCAYVYRLFQQQGVDPNRIELLGWLPETQQHLTLYDRVDIALDTFPYSGTTTTCEAMWMGVPVITRAGKNHVSRVGISLLSSVSLEELIAESVEDYIQKAIELANDKERLQELRANLRARMQAAPLTNAGLIARSVEDAYRTMWRDFCGHSPVALVKPVVAQGGNPDEIEQEINLGIQHQQSGQLQEAEACYQQVLQWQPDHADAWHLLGVIAAQQKHYQRATERINHAIQLNPKSATFYSNLGNAYQERGKLAQAIECYQKVIQLQPKYADVYQSLGIAYQEQGNLEEAVQSYKQFLKLKPDHAEVYHRLGNTFQRQWKWSEAIDCYERLLQLKPDYFQAYYNLGNVFKEQGKLAEAIQFYQKALQLKPDYARACINLGIIFYSQGKLTEAISFFRRALQVEPQYAMAYDNLLFSLQYSGDYEPSAIAAEHRQWAERHAKPLAAAIQPHSNDSNPERQLRIGYISGDFNSHSVALFFEPLLATHNPHDFEVVCYASNKFNDATTQRLKQRADGWREIHALSDEQVAERVRQDEVDILVDLSGHTLGNRLLVFARKPAPVQVSYLGYPSTTGLETMDYRLTDVWADPEGLTEHLHTEQLVRLPHGFLCYQSPADCPGVSPPPVLQVKHVTFGSFNNLSKVNPELICCWAEILKAVPDSRLIIKFKPLADPDTRAYIHGLFQQHQIAPERLELRGWLPDKTQHLAFYAQVDIALDTFPYHGTTTTCEALWMGVPVITQAGQSHVSRVGVSLLSSVGLEELIAESAEDYIQKAIDLANNVEWLSELRANLRSRMQAAPLTNASLIAESVEHAYRTMWREYCNQSFLEPDQRLVEIEGGIKVCVKDDLNSLTTYVLLEQRDWFESEMAFIRRLITPGMQILDIGANHGVYTLTMAKLLQGQGQVTAYEPDHSVVQRLRKSVDANVLTTIEIVNAGLSDHEGEATLFLSTNSELNSLHQRSANQRQETIQLLTLDRELEQRGWQDISFIKLDAEGEESNILAGGQRFFSEQSPLIMFELKHGTQINLSLIHLFQQLGYDTYRFVPGLDLLVPFDPNQPVDGYQLNLFACKADRAQQLAERNLLIKEVSEKPALPTPSYWLDGISALGYATPFLSQWRSLATHAQENARTYLDGIGYFLLAKSEKATSEERLASLQYALECLQRAVREKPSFERRCSLARVAAELGQRQVSVQALQELCNALESSQKNTVDEPFLTVNPQYDNQSFNDNLQDWLFVSTLESYENSRVFSSYYSPQKSVTLLRQIVQKPFHSRQAERRLQLAQKRLEGIQEANSPGVPALAKQNMDSTSEPFPISEIFDPPLLSIVDIGAMELGGREDRLVRLSQCGIAKIIGFEPLPEECAKLNEKAEGSRHYLPYAIADGSERTLYVTNTGMTSSLLPPNEGLCSLFMNLAELMQVIRTDEIATKRLDDIPEIAEAGCDLLKVDVQGLEFEIFCNATTTLSNCLMVQTEVEFVPLYLNQPLFAEVDQVLRKNGFVFHKFLGLSGRPFKPLMKDGNPNVPISQVLWSDAVYVRDFTQLNRLAPEKLLKLAALLHELYGSFDLCKHVLTVYDEQTGEDLTGRYLERLVQKKEIQTEKNQTTPAQIKKQLDSGVAHHQAGRLAKAEACFKQVLQWQPHNADALHLLGVIAAQQGQYQTAIEKITQAIECKPETATFYSNLGNAYQESGQLPQAIECYEKAIQLQPDHADTYKNLGIAFKEQGQLEEAVQAYKQVLRLKPDYADAHHKLANILQEQQKLKEAIQSHQQTLQLQPDHPQACNNLALALSHQGKTKEAIQFYRRALKIKPDYALAHSNLLFGLHYSDYEPSAIYAEHLQWAERHAKPLAAAIEAHDNDRNPERRLRVGYVSGDFWNHSVAHFLEPLLAAHNQCDFEVICYTNSKKVDATTERLRQLTDSWREIHALDDEQVAELVRRDGIDILVDLSGHTKSNRMLVFARKPAPVQATYIGYPDTTGLSTMDYRLTDAWADPAGQTEHLHTEQLLRLPHGFLCYQPPLDCPQVNPSPALQSRQITFGSFNNLAKVNAELIDCWAEILKAVPNSRLIIKSKSLVDIDTCDYVHGLFQQSGIEADRVELLGWLPDKNQHLALYNRVDIALDTFPYHSTTTTCEAMWMGVPVITRAGETHVSRVGVSLLSSVGVEEFIAESAEDYIQKAIELADSTERLQELRANLRSRMQAAPLTNADLIARSLEDAYRTMWRRFCATSVSEGNSARESPKVPIGGTV